MKKYNIMGFEMAKMDDVKWCVRKARKSIDTFGRDKSDEAVKFARFILECAVRQMFIDEIRAAKTDEERTAILEMTGDFIVVNVEGKGKDRIIRYFGRFEDDTAIVEKMPYRAMHFDYESKAEEVAEYLGENWSVVDLNPQEYETNKRMIDYLTSDTQK